MKNDVTERTQDPSDELVLHRYFPYQVRVFYTEVSSAVAEVYQKEDGMAAAEWRCIAILSSASSMTAVEIVAASSMDKVTVSRALSKLRKRGWVSAAKNHKDGRSKLLKLSKQGQAVLHKIVPKALEVERALLAGVSEEELDQFRKTIAKISRNRASLGERLED